VYCVRAVWEGAVGEARGVAVCSRVGGGVSLGGTGVKVATRVGVSVPGSSGWKGVGDGVPWGLAVTNTSVGGPGCRYCGSEQEREARSRAGRASRKDVFMKVSSAQQCPHVVCGAG
jgi:hypothetical protein